MEETADFLTASAEKAESNSNILSDINLLKNDLILLQARLNHWHQTKAHTDSRTVDTEIKKLYHDFIEFMKRMESVPEINYKEFSNRPVKEPIGTPPELNAKYAKWLLAIVIPFILFVFSILAWNAYQAFYPKSDEKIDNKRCWVTTDWAFTKLMNEPSFQPKGIITDLPGTKTYHVLEIATVEMGQKCYKIEDKKLAVTGWVQEHDLAKIHDVCFKNPPKSTEPKSSIDKTKCWLKTDEFITELYFKPEHMPQKIGQLHGSKEYQVLDVEQVYSTFFFKIKDEETQTVGWVRNFNLTSVSPICFSNKSQGSSNTPIHESKFDKMQDEFKKAERDFNKEYEALKRENEKGFDEAKREIEKTKKEVMNKFNKQ